MYKVTIVGSSATEGNGDPTTLTARTLPDEAVSQSQSPAGHAPEAPIGLEAEPVNSSAIRISWSHGTPHASYFTVCYNPVQSSLSVDEKIVQCTKR